MLHLTDPERTKLKNALSIKSSLSGNLLTLIGVEEIKERFPDLWDKKKEAILETVRSVMKQFSDPSTDMILPFGGDRFVILFGVLSHEEALVRAGMIKAEVLKRFAGDDGLCDLDVAVSGMDLDSGEIRSGRLGELIEQAASVKAPDTATDAEAAKPTSRRATELYRASIESLTDDKVSDIEGLEQQFGFRIEELEFAFLPFLYNTRNVFSVFECLPVRSSATGRLLTGYDVLPPDSDTSVLAELDHMNLMRVRHGLVDMAMRKRTAVVVACLSFDTVIDRQQCAEYLKVLESIPSDLRNYLVLSIYRVPVGVPEGRFSQLVSPFRKYCRAVVVSMSSTSEPLGHVKASGAFCALYDVEQLGKSEQVTPALVKKLVVNARRHGLQLAIKGLTSKAVIRGCRNLQVDYLAGQSLAELSDYVGPISEFKG